MFGLSRNSNSGAASTNNLNISRTSDSRAQNRSQVSNKASKEEEKEIQPKKATLTQKVLGSGSKATKAPASKVNIEEAILEQLILGDIDLSDKSKFNFYKLTEF